MTKENLTSINVIIDRSGSMHGLATDTIGGYNQFLADQKLVPGDALFTLCLFNSDYHLVYDAVPLNGVPNLSAETYKADGGTALLDAVGVTIDTVGKKLSAMKEEDRPSKVIFLIVTDGHENSSAEYTASQIKNMISHQREVYKWEFVFMGANIDAVAEGTALGISAANSLGYAASSVGTAGLYSTVSNSMSSYRAGAVSQANFFNPNNLGEKK